LAETIAVCTEAGLRVVGAGSNLADALETVRVERCGLTLSIMAMAEREFSLAAEHAPGACPAEPEAVYLRLRREADSADAVIVVLHGGNEYYPLPGPHLVSRCRFLVDAGASAVVCSHSHVPSGMEIYAGVPIAYGLGNFMFACEAPAPVGWTAGLLAQLTFSRAKCAGLRLLPVRQNVEAGRIELAHGATLEAALTATARCSETIADPASLARAWDRFCASRRVEYLTRALCLTRGERALLRAGVWPHWRASRRQVLNLVNSLECESHREAARRVLVGEPPRKG
jgi:poly-gamma-glutamate synthesis protein (capsule biosynthesis protein)